LPKVLTALKKNCGKEIMAMCKRSLRSEGEGKQGGMKKKETRRRRDNARENEYLL